MNDVEQCLVGFLLGLIIILMMNSFFGKKTIQDRDECFKNAKKIGVEAEYSCSGCKYIFQNK